MKEHIFEHNSYKGYLNQCIRSSPKQGRGFKAALASAANCQSAYISQVLNGDRHLNLEQAEGINSFLMHSEDESQFFLLLVLYERAGTKQLKERLRRKMQVYVDRFQTLKERFNIKETLTPEIQAQYYSSWHYTAIHILLTIPRFRTKESICKAMGLTSDVVTPILEFLVSAGLAFQKHSEYLPGKSNTFVGKDSPFVKHHHSNWRSRAIDSIAVNRADEIHYSSVFSLSAEDAIKIRFLVLKAIEDVRKIRLPSKEEELHSFCLDLFRLA